MTTWEMLTQYLYIGYTHVLPLGFDHILFMLCLFFGSTQLKTVIIQCSLFTLAHSLSLACSATGFIAANPHYVEPLIALSILFTAIENIVKQNSNKWRMLVIFLFGLIHGMGFANALKEIGLPADHFFTALISFNIGVELGQISILLLAYFAIAKWWRNKTWYQQRIVYPLSAIFACIALYWTIERILAF